MGSFESRPEVRKVVRLFLATPGDVPAEGECVEELIRELNRSGGVAAEKNVLLEIVDGSHSPTRHMGLPEQVILDQFSPEQCPIFVGILWQRFGTPTGGANPRTGRPLESGTEAEFEAAYQAWKEYPDRHHLLIYRCNRQTSLRPGEIDAEQLARVNRFFRQFEAGGEHPGLIGTFEELTELQVLLLHDLTRLLQQFEDEPPAEAPAAPSPAAETEAPASPAAVRPGEPARPGAVHAPQPMALLALDMDSHSRMLEQFGPDGAALLDALEKLARQVTADLGGICFHWAGDGGLFGFEGAGRQYRLLLALVEIHQRLPLLRLNRTDNPARIPFEIRMAAHDGPVQYECATGSIHSDAVNLVCHLLDQGTDPGEVCITHDLLIQLDPDLQGLFHLKGRFEGIPVYRYPEPRREALPPRAGLDRLASEARADASFVTLCLENSPVYPSKRDIETIRSGVDKIYDGVQRFLGWCGALDDRWSPGYLAEVETCAATLGRIDDELLASFRRRLKAFPDEVGEPLDLLRVSDYLANRRRWPMTRLERLRDRLRPLLAAPAAAPPASLAPAPASPAALAKVARLTGSRDPLEVEDAFAELATRHRPDLLRLAAGAGRDLLDRLWLRTDRLLVEDLHADPNLRWEHPQALFQALRANPADPGRFRAVERLLASDGPLDRERAVQAAAEGGCPEEELEQVLWRSLLVAHPSGEVRRQASRLVDVSSLWTLLTHPEVPAAVILQTALRLQETGDRDLQKLLFDCTRSRVAGLLEGGLGGELEEARTLLLLFQSCEAFAEEGYRERLAKLSRACIARASRLGLERRDVEARQAWLEQRQALPRTWESPALVETLPDTVQRHVAREGSYLDHCVKQRDAIALETFPHLGPHNLARLLTGRRFNGRLLFRLCNERPFCANSVIVRKILHQQHCPVGFARKHLGRLGSSEVQKLAADPEASPEVKALLGKPRPSAA